VKEEKEETREEEEKLRCEGNEKRKKVGVQELKKGKR